MSNAPLAGLYEAYHAEQQAAQKRFAEAIVAAITNGSTRHQVADEIGVTYDAVVKILKRAGLTAPFAKRGPKGGMRLHSERNQVIVAAYRVPSPPSMATIGHQWGITQEMVRQILVDHERRTGETIERRREQRNPPPLERVEWRCSDCGAARRITPSAAAMHKKCMACEIRARRAASPITDAMIEEWIVRRLSGDSWSEIARSRGWASNSSNLVPQFIWRHLRRTGRMNEVAAIWRGSSTRWLQRRFPAEVPEVRNASGEAAPALAAMEGGQCST